MPQPTALMYDVEEVSISWLIANETKIQPLLAAQTDPSPFQSLPWLESWWHVFGANYDSLILVVRNAENILGLIPLMSERDHKRKHRVLEWLGTGRSDHAPLLLFPDSGVTVLAAAVRYLRTTYRDWTLLSLRTLQESQFQHAINMKTMVSCFLEKEDVSPRTAIRSTWDSYLAEKSSKHRGNIRRLMKQMQGIVSAEVVCEKNFTQQLLNEIAEVERQSWKAQEGSLRLEGEGMKFYNQFLQNLANREQLEIWCCRFEGKLLAYLITFNYEKRIFYYNGAYRADCNEFHPGFSPGSALIAYAVKSAHDREMQSFDFLRGDEPYKHLWKNEDRNLYHLVVRGSGIKGYAALLWTRARWQLRKYPLAHKARQWSQRLRKVVRTQTSSTNNRHQQ